MDQICISRFHAQVTLTEWPTTAQNEIDFETEVRRLRLEPEDREIERSLHDRVTGLPNRALLIANLDEAVRGAHLGDGVALALCDVDDFQFVNEALGTEAADVLLAEVARRIERIAGDALVARFGSDEFAILLTGKQTRERMEAITEGLWGAMKRPFGTAGEAVVLSLSMGLVAGPATGTSSEVIASALAALDKAKAQGGGRWAYASGREQQAATRRLELATALRRACDNGEIRAWFQPIVQVHDGAILGFESLARWERPDGSMVAPWEFIPLAEQTGLIGEIGLTMLDQACNFLADLTTEADSPNTMVTVNLSPKQLLDDELPAQIEAVLERYPIPRISICLELTESFLVPGDEVTLDRLQALRDLGVSLAIDDFGTGYSSLAYLTQFPVDLLKLDRAFVHKLHDDPRRVTVVRSVVGLARELGITVLCEGVETIRERDVLLALGCELGQGFFWERAIPAAAAIRLYTGSRTIASTDEVRRPQRRFALRRG